MYKVIEFKSDIHSGKLACLNQLTEFLNSLGYIGVSDIEKEWNILTQYDCQLRCIIVYYDFSEEDM